MYQVENEPMETIHLYVMREEAARSSIWAAMLSFFTLAFLIFPGTTTPYTRPETRLALRLPAVPSSTRTFSTPITIILTGVKTYPARVVYGTLSRRNGSIIAQTIPAGFVVMAQNGVQVATDAVVYVPGVHAVGNGAATVAAHVVAADVHVPAFAITAVIGPSLFIRHPQPFTGGQPVYSVKFATAQEKVRAITRARAVVVAHVVELHYPCHKTNTTLLSWHCRIITYLLPACMHVTSAFLHGSGNIVTV